MKETIYPTKEKAYLVGTCHHCYRAGIPAEIIGVKICKADRNSMPALCYEVEFSDGDTNTVLVSEVPTWYEIIPFSQIVKGKTPKVNS